MQWFKFSTTIDCRILPDGDQAIAIYRVCPLRALTLARDRSSPTSKTSIGQECQILPVSL